MHSYDRRLQSLLGAAARIFADRGFHATSMRDLSQASGMSLAGIYHYVKSKEELLYLIQDRCLGQVLTGGREAIAGECEPRARILALVRHHVGFFARHVEEMKVLSREADTLTGPMRAQVRRRKREYLELLLQLLKELEAPRVSSLTAAYALFGMMNWIYTWYHPTGSVTPDQLGEDIGRLFLDGIAPTATPAPALLAATHGG